MPKFEVVVFETLRYTKVVEAKNASDAEDQVYTLETSDMDRDNEYYESNVADVREVEEREACESCGKPFSQMSIDGGRCVECGSMICAKYPATNNDNDR